jgi:hypothetical protein
MRNHKIVKTFFCLTLPTHKADQIHLLPPAWPATPSIPPSPPEELLPLLSISVGPMRGELDLG